MLTERAHALGFADIGVAGIALDEDELRLSEWLEAGWHGDMHYMARHGSMRARPAQLLPGTLRVVSARMNYWPTEARTAAEVLADPSASPHAVQRAVLGGTYALAAMGRFDRCAEVAARGHEVEDQVEGLLRPLGAYGEIWGLVLAGEFDTAEKRSADIVRISSPGQYIAWGMVNQLASMVEVARGRFPDAVLRMEQTVAALTSESTAAWSFPLSCGPTGNLWINRGKEVVREWRFPVRAVEVPAGRGASPEPTGNRLASVGDDALRAARPCNSRAEAGSASTNPPLVTGSGAAYAAPFLFRFSSLRLTAWSCGAPELIVEWEER